MKNKNKWLKIALLAGFVLFLAACGNVNEPINADSTGIWDRYILLNLSRIILWLSDLFGGSYGMGIIVFTMIIRVLLTPLYQKQVKSQREMQELQPELDAIKEKYPNKDRASLEMMQEEQQKLMEDRGINQFASLIPLLIQLPVMMALYQSILRTEELRSSHFLWLNLGEPDPYFILPILAAALTLGTTYLSMKSSMQDNALSKGLMFLSPAMILFISLGLPSAIALYWVVSNGVTLVMTLLFNNPYKIIAEREAKKEAERQRQQELRREFKRRTGRKYK